MGKKPSGKKTLQNDTVKISSAAGRQLLRMFSVYVLYTLSSYLDNKYILHYINWLVGKTVLIILPSYSTDILYRSIRVFKCSCTFINLFLFLLVTVSPLYTIASQFSVLIRLMYRNIHTLTTQIVTHYCVC